MSAPPAGPRVNGVVPEPVSLAVLASRLRSGRISSEGLVTGCLAAIDAGRSVNAVVELDAEGALRSAWAADRLLREDPAAAGPLCGLPVTVKRTFEVRGYRHLEADLAFGADPAGPAIRDATAVAEARAAGAIVLGRTNAPPRAADIDTWHPAFGRTTHPADSTLSPGGSSGGSAAAVAAGHTVFDLASDDAGSARVPAQMCGVFSLRPTLGGAAGRGAGIPAFGHVPGPLTEAESPEMLSVAPIARTAADLTFLWQVLGSGGRRREDGRFAPGAGAPLAAVLADPSAPMAPEVAGALGGAVERLRSAGHRITDVGLPVDLAQTWLLCQQLLFAADAAETAEAAGAAGVANAAATRKAAATAEAAATAKASEARAALTAAAFADLPEPTPETSPLEIAWWCAGLSHRRWLGLQHARAAMRQRWQGFFAEHSALLLPVVGVSRLRPRDVRVPLLADEVAVGGVEIPTFSLSAWCAPASVAGLPAVTVPFRDPGTGHAAAFQLVGGHGRESALLELAERISVVLG